MPVVHVMAAPALSALHGTDAFEQSVKKEIFSVEALGLKRSKHVTVIFHPVRMNDQKIVIYILLDKKDRTKENLSEAALKIKELCMKEYCYSSEPRPESIEVTALPIDMDMAGFASYEKE